MPERDYIQKLAKGRYEGQIQNSFEKELQVLAQGLTLKEVAQRIQSGDINGAIKATNIDKHQFDRLRKDTEDAVKAGHKETTKLLPAVKRGGQKIQIQFDRGSRRAANTVEDLHTELIREVTDETRESIRDHIQYGLEKGKNPRDIARGIRGVYNPATKSYDGGVIGLTKQQSKWVINAERQLRSGDPKELRQYLGRKLRDKRYDKSILKAINEGTELDEKTIQKATHAYRRKAIKYRSETIARDQALEACTQGQELAMDDHIDEGAIRDKDILKFWVTSGDSRVRDAHFAVPSMNRGGIRRGDMFQTPLGPLKRPRDRSSSGSVPANVIQCRCSQNIRVRRQ